MSELTARTVRAVAAVIASGTPFVLVSGRPPRWIPPVADPAGIGGLAVCSNGALVYDLTAGRALVVHELDPVVLHDTAEVLERAMPGIRVAAERSTRGPITE